MFKIFINWVHLFAAMTWLGAIIYNAVAVEGSASILRTGEHLRVRSALGKVFSPAVWTALTALLVSGFVKLHWHVETSYSATLSTTWGQLLIGKWILAAILVGLGGASRYMIVPALEERQQRVATRADTERLGRLITSFSRLSLILAAGLVLIVILL